MDRNFILALGLSFLIYTLWSVQFAPQPQPPESQSQSQEVPGETADSAAPDEFAQQPQADDGLESLTGLPALQSPQTPAAMTIPDSDLLAATTAADRRCEFEDQCRVSC